MMLSLLSVATLTTSWVHAEEDRAPAAAAESQPADSEPAEEPQAQPRTKKVYNLFAGGLLGYQTSTQNMGQGVNWGGMIGYRGIPGLHLVAYASDSMAISTSSKVSGLTSTHQGLYGVQALAKFGTLYAGGAAGVTMTRTTSTTDSFTYTIPGHVGPVAGIDFPIREDVTLGFEGRYLFHTASTTTTTPKGSSTSTTTNNPAYQMAVFGATVKAWF